MKRAAPLTLAVLLAACPAPGEGPKAERGYQRTRPVIAALERYRAARGAYPDSLGLLVPEFIHASALAAPGAPREGYPLEYAREDSSYVLGFRYAGPGMNHCRYRPAGGWRCGGYF